jgi:predicted SnoaL-like aldol condensation-catalyzing enzyme
MLTDQQITYTRVRRMIADGNFVLLQSEVQMANVAYAFYDLFRVADGKLAEHWDARLRVPASTASGLGVF